MDASYAGVARELENPRELEQAREAICETVHLTDYDECALHMRGLPTREKIKALHRYWFDTGIPLVVELGVWGIRYAGALGRAPSSRPGKPRRRRADRGAPRHSRPALRAPSFPRPCSVGSGARARSGDRFTLNSAIRPEDVAKLLALARGRSRVVELGTGTGWSALVLALDDSARRIITYDPMVRREREDYLAMVDRAVRERIELRNEPDISGPRTGDVAELLFIDSSHDCDSVAAAFAVWQDCLAPGAVVAFHDYRHPEYPGVQEAVRKLELLGEEKGGLFVWRAPTAKPNAR